MNTSVTVVIITDEVTLLVMPYWRRLAEITLLVMPL
jgi:hypothetical protein